MSNTAVSEMIYATGVDYEVLQNSLNREIAYHIEIAREVGHETDEGAKHMDMARRIADIKDSISPFDEQQMQVVSALLQDVRLHRTDLAEALALKLQRDSMLDEYARTEAIHGPADEAEVERIMHLMEA